MRVTHAHTLDGACSWVTSTTGSLLTLITAALLLAGGCSRHAPVERIEWPVMGTVAAVQTRGIEAKAAAAQARKIVQSQFAADEELLNAHNPQSEICRLAPLSEDEILRRCNPSVSNCYAAAFRLMHLSGGAFNPRWRGPKTLDLGAIAKGFAVDVAVSEVERRGGGGQRWMNSDVLIDLGGNLKAVGGSWKTGIAGSDEVLLLTNGMACATSAEYYRGKHIHDGRTGLVVSNGVESVTVVHPTSAMLADALSTTLFVLGREEGDKFLKRHYPEIRVYWIMNLKP